MRKAKPKPKYLVQEICGPMPLTIYSAGTGQEGGGYLVFHETWVEVVLKPESAWKQAPKAKRKDANKLKRPDGTWDVWFLLTRAFVLSKESLEESEREIGPADSMREAANHLRSAGKVRAMAADSRLEAFLSACANNVDIPIDAVSSDYAFFAWFEGQIAEHLEDNDHEFIEAVNGYYRAANRLQAGYPQDVLRFSRALKEQASIAGEPPTKKSVRIALGKESLRTPNMAEMGQNPPSQRDGALGQSKNAADTIDPDTFTRLLKKTGFSWLPDGKTGPKRQHKYGKGRTAEAFDLHPRSHA